MNSDRERKLAQLVKALPTPVTDQWPGGWLTPLQVITALAEHAILHEEWGVRGRWPNGSNVETWNGRRERAEADLSTHTDDDSGAEWTLIRRLYVVLPTEDVTA